MSGDEIVLDLRLHPHRFWLLLDVSVAGGKEIAFVLDSGAPASVIHPAILAALIAEGRAERARGNWYRLRDMAVAGAPIPDALIRAGGPTERVRVGGIIGLDYLSQFARVCVDIPSLRLTLTPMPDGTKADS